MAKKKKTKVAKKKPAKKKVAKKATKAKSKPARKRPEPLSVDGVLKKFEKERATKQASLESVRKRIADLEAKSKAMQEQITKLTQQEVETVTLISQLDARRDEEVSEMLSRLGVQITSAPTDSVPEVSENDTQPEPETPADLFDKGPEDTDEQNDSSSNDENSD